MGPLEILYSWQALVIAILASGLTQAIKRTLDILRGRHEDADGTLDFWETIGRELRRDSVVINNVVLPSLVILLGAAFAVLLPLRPEALLRYTALYAPGWQAYLVFAAWGAACGAKADWIFMRVRSTIGDMAKRRPNAG